MQKIKALALKPTKELLLLAALSFLAVLNTFSLLTQNLQTLAPLQLTGDMEVTKLVFYMLVILTIGTVLFFQPKFNFKQLAAKTLLVFALPTFLLAAVFTVTVRTFPMWSYVMTNFFTVIAVILAFISYKKYDSWNAFRKDFVFEKSTEKVSRKKNVLVAALLTAVFAVNLGYGTFNLSKFAAVDEALWTFGRITKFWNNALDGEWKKTMVSDKPGITVVLLSGMGLLDVNPKEYEQYSFDGTILPAEKNVEEMNFALRFPIVLFSSLMLFVFYFFLKRLSGTATALVATGFIGFSPILLGISTIINPDALLWSFMPLSLISYFNYLKEKKAVDLHWAGIFLGLALLTKYIANLLVVFYFALIFIEPILTSLSFNKQSISTYFKKALSDYLLLILIALFVFYLPLPAAWVDLSRVLEGTIFSKAFLKVWPLFIAIISLVLLDVYVAKGKYSAAVTNFLSRFSAYFAKILSALFLFFALGAMANTYLNMRWFDLEAIIASPKTSFTSSNILSFMFANFYSMIFGILPIALFLILIYVFKAGFFPTKQGQEERWSIYLVFFTLLYYTASTVNFVSATVRYQIVIFPLMFIIAAISLRWMVSKLAFGKNLYFQGALFISLFAFSILSLESIKPFYFSYASDLLPKEYVLNLKDMGDGSYQAAQYLNGLPGAENLFIWTDKRGVCTFFKGKCTSDLNFGKKGLDIDYFVVSSGREIRTGRMAAPKISGGNKSLANFNSLYQPEINSVFKLEIGGRPNNYVKVVAAKEILN